MKSFEMAEVFFYLLHLCLDVAVGDDSLGADNSPLGEVETIEQDGNPGLEGDVVEAFLPLRLGFACSFRGDAEAERVGLPCLFCDDVGGVHLLRAIDGYASEPAHQYAHGPEEPFLLHEEVAVVAFGPAVDVADDEVPVARVRGKGYDTFLGQGFGDGLSEVEPSKENLVAKILEHASWLRGGE